MRRRPSESGEAGPRRCHVKTIRLDPVWIPNDSLVERPGGVHGLQEGGNTGGLTSRPGTRITADASQTN